MNYFLYYNSIRYLLKNGNKLYKMTENVIQPNSALSLVKETDIISSDIYYHSPWISCGYFETVVDKNEEIIVPIYVTDYNMVEYTRNDYSKDFLIEVNINDKVLLYKVKAGEHNLNIGSVGVEGQIDFSIQATDLSNNIKSIIDTKHLLVVDKNTYEITEAETYRVTKNDLNAFNITVYTGEYVAGSLTDEQMTNNIIGLNQLFNQVKNNGFRKIVMYNESSNDITSYRLNPGNTRDKAIIIPSNFILDLNGTKIKQHVSYGSDSLLVRMKDDCIDTHIINGYIEGDYDEHIVDKTDPEYPVPEEQQPIFEGEGYNLINISGAFSGIDNLDVSLGTGYTITNGTSSKELLSALKTWEPLFVIDGKDVPSDIILTSDYRDLTNGKKYRSMSCNTYGGYGGISSDFDICYVHFYDKDKNYLCTKKTRQYKLINIPIEAIYARVSLLTTTTDNIGNGSGVGFCIECRDYKQLTNFKATNIYVHDCRTVAYATGIFNGFLLEDCVVENCGQNIPGCVTALAIDVEDGYQYSENYYFHNTKLIGGDVGRPIMVHVCGHNIMIWGDKCEGEWDLRYGVKGLCIKGTTSSLKYTPNSSAKTGFARIFNNTLTHIQVKNDWGESGVTTTIRDCICACNTTADHQTHFRNCDVEFANKYYNNSGGIYYNCNINVLDASYLLNNAIFNECSIKGEGYIRPHTNTTTFNNSEIYIPIKEPVSNGTSILNNCILHNDFYNNTYNYLTINDCIIK